jgi:hypothetical protein
MITAIGGLSIATVVSSPALAACGLSDVKIPTAIKTAATGTQNQNQNTDGPSIVGMWQFTFTSTGNSAFGIPDGAPLDQGYSQWHSDGTEIMNSGRDPVTQSFCLGTYASDGHRTYSLNHFALSWDNTGKFCKAIAPATNCFVGPTNIREQVTLNLQGDTYTGHVSITQYDTNNNAMFTLLGTVVGHRIKPEGH